MPTGPQNETWGAGMEGKDDRWNHTGGSETSIKGQVSQWDAWWMPAHGNCRCKMTFIAIKSFTWGPIRDWTDDQFQAVCDTKEEREKNDSIWTECVVGANLPPPTLTHTHTHTRTQATIVNPYANVIEPNFQYTHTHESLKCQGSNCWQR